MKKIDLSAMKREELEQFAMSANEKVEELEAKIKYYEEQFRRNNTQKYVRKGEKVDENQLAIDHPLFNEPEANSNDEPEPSFSEICKPNNKKRKPKQKGHRDEMLKDIETETTEYTLSEDEKVCPKCGSTLTKMKKEFHREIEVIPAKVKVHTVVRYSYVCRNCEKNGTETTIVRANAPAPLLKGSITSPSLISHLAVRKYGNRDAIFKISTDFKEMGVKLSKQTLSNMLCNVAKVYLSPLYNRMITLLLKEFIIHADETPVQVLHEEGRTAKQRSYMWVFTSAARGNRTLSIYHYAPSRGRDVLDSFVKTFDGIVQSDGYAVYQNSEAPYTNVGCMAHVRRKYVEAINGQKDAVPRNSGAGKGFRFASLLIRMDQRAKRIKNIEDQQRFKERRIKPVLEGFFAWAENEMKKLPSESLLTSAVKYTLNQRKYLENYLIDPRLEITNNKAERAVRPFAMGRKSWLFCNTPKGAQTSAIYYSIYETAKESGLDPGSYIKWLLEEMRGKTEFSDQYLDTLIPGSKMIPEECRSKIREYKVIDDTEPNEK